MREQHELSQLTFWVPRSSSASRRGPLAWRQRTTASRGAGSRLRNVSTTGVSRRSQARLSPNRNVYRPSSHSCVAACRTTVMRSPSYVNSPGYSLTRFIGVVRFERPRAQRRRAVSWSMCDSFPGLRTAYSPVMRPSPMRTATTVSIWPLSPMISAGVAVDLSVGRFYRVW